MGFDLDNHLEELMELDSLVANHPYTVLVELTAMIREAYWEVFTAFKEELNLGKEVDHLLEA